MVEDGKIKLTNLEHNDGQADTSMAGSSIKTNYSGIGADGSVDLNNLDM